MVPQYARSVGMKMSWNRGEISPGNVALLNLPTMRGTTGLMSGSSSALPITQTRLYENVRIMVAISHMRIYLAV